VAVLSEAKCVRSQEPATPFLGIYSSEAVTWGTEEHEDTYC
jgi:hypothetical protein